VKSADSSIGVPNPSRPVVFGADNLCAWRLSALGTCSGENRRCARRETDVAIQRVRLRFTSYALYIATLTFLFTDIEGSTALLRRLGDDVYSQVLADHHRIIRTGLHAHHGTEQGTQGDSFFASFTSPSACVTAAVEMQRALSNHKWPAGEQLRVRMGIHTGEAWEASTGLVGYEVHRAARIGAVGHGGQVLLSSAAAGLVQDSLPADVDLRDLGAHRLKDLGRPEGLFQIIADGLPAEFPPVRSLNNPDLPNNLPVALSSFVGRRAELAEVRALVLDFRLVTLTGAGGSGKTRLALQAAAELLDGTGEGVWFVELAPISDPDQVPTAVIDALQLRHGSDGSPLDSLLKALRDQNVLITLDNCEHVIDAVAKLADLIGRNCPKARLVATSREPLGVDGEEVYRVRSLSLPPAEVEGVEDLGGSDAVELFVTRARAHDSTFSLEDSVAPLVASLCRRLDGIPLAIELAACRLSSMSLEDLYDRLDQRFRLLTGGSRNLLPRQQTLGAMVAWSYDLLSEPEREVLRRLSVFVGSLDLRAAEAVCATDSVDTFNVADLLGSLVNKSLVAGERSSMSLRYRLLETIRQYAGDQLIQAGGQALALEARRLHAEYYLRLCEQAAPELIGTDQARWLKRLDLDWDNIQAGFNTFASHPERTEEVLRLGVAVADFITSRLHRLPIAFLREALVCDVAVSTPLRARALLALAAMIYMTTRGAERPDEPARDLCGDVVKLARELDDPSLEVEALVWLTFISHDLGEQERALSHAEGALRIARRIGDPRLVGRALCAVGYAQPPSPEAAREFFLEALVYSRQAGDLWYVCNELSSLSRIYPSGGTDLERVRAMLARSEGAIELAEELGSTFHLNYLWTNLGLLCYLSGEVDDAERYSRRAVLSARRLGIPLSDYNVFVFACCATSKGDFLRGAQLTGAHDAIDARLPESWRGYWSPMEIEMRDLNRARLVEALGEEEFERASAVGRGLPSDRVADLALGRVRPGP
jgi:predicted ATPase/class 3 adenylate cyclase